jgi:hypothetical protein
MNKDIKQTVLQMMTPVRDLLLQLLVKVTKTQDYYIHLCPLHPKDNDGNGE